MNTHNILRLSAIFFLSITVLSCAKSEEQFVCPPFIHLGDTVAIISPASQLGEKTHLLADDVLRSWGLVPVRSGFIPSQAYRKGFSGTEKERIADLKWAFENKNVKAIICARGGYGLIRMLDQIPAELYRNHPKWLVGFSDISNILCQMSACRVMSIHGAMCSSFKLREATDSTCTLMRDLLFGKIPEYTIAANPYNHQGKVSGRLVGGNLSTFYPLVGTKHDPFQTEDDLILFIEEVGESYHNIDRMINFLKLHGVLSKVKGIIVGDFTECSADLKYRDVWEMLDEYFSPLGIPVCYGFPGGHADVNFPVIMGATTHLNIAPEKVNVSFELK